MGSKLDSIEAKEDESSSYIFETNNLIYNLNDPNYLENTIGIYYSRSFPEIIKINELYYCKNCHSCPTFYFDNDILKEFNKIKVKYSCKCSNALHSINIEEFNLKFKYNKNDMEGDIKKYLFCSICSEKFNYYCLNHDQNLCKNYNKESTNHKDENIFDFNEDIIYSHLDLIKSKFNFEEKEKEGDCYKDFPKFEEFRNLVKILINNYILYPSYSIYTSINNLYNALNKFAFYCYNENEKIKSPYGEGIEIIRNKNKLNQLDPEYYPIIIKLDLRQSRAYNIKILGEFENLRELNLRENCIYTIKPFLKAKWKNLRSLNLSSNYLGDENIKYFRRLELNELTSLILDYNHFTNYELFIAIGKNSKGSFQKLEDLRLGLNDFRVAKKANKKNSDKNNIESNTNMGNKIEIKSKKTKLERKTLEELKGEFADLKFNKLKKFYAYNGVFNQETAETLIPLIKMENLENFNISNNNLRDINFIKNCDWKELKYLDYPGNFIKDEDTLWLKEKFPNLKE